MADDHYLNFLYRHISVKSTAAKLLSPF